MSNKSPLREKSYRFSLGAIRFCRRSYDRSAGTLFAQFLRAATSIGANIEEGIAGQSRKDFFAKISIAHKEAREANYWLRLFKDSEIGDRKEAGELAALSMELVKMLSSTIKTTKEKNES